MNICLKDEGSGPTRTPSGRLMWKDHQENLAGISRSPSPFKARTNETLQHWTIEAETAYQWWKDCMEILPTITPPVRGEILLLHVAVSFDEVGAILFAEKRNMQIPIYFVSKALPEVERRYAESEKLALAIVYATRHLRRYFTDHPIRLLTDKPIEWTFLKPDRSIRMVKWAAELEKYDIEYGMEGYFEGYMDKPAEVEETNMSSNRNTFEAKKEEKHQVGDLKMHETSHSPKKGKCLIEPRFESEEEQQASTQ
ncbi:reverse transcriptase domain-containing protein [Artemisia annua]|uniref:Reverse transcriptase domain-containing protein n=1 Tax=Artemisia annua TaxID=35608 RepID=A0A2U1P5J3_ARTAN|nr:reverse transcriptase domain-containing protein [Artemisia annua]